MLLSKRFLKPFSLSKKKINTVCSANPSPFVYIIQKNEIYPPFFEEYIKICDIPSFVKGNSIECMNTLILPSVETQISLLKDIREIEKLIPIHDIKPYLLYYLSTDNIEKANELLQEYQKYLSSIEHLHHIIASVFN